MDKGLLNLWGLCCSAILWPLGAITAHLSRFSCVQVKITNRCSLTSRDARIVTSPECCQLKALNYIRSITTFMTLLWINTMLRVERFSHTHRKEGLQLLSWRGRGSDETTWRRYRKELFWQLSGVKPHPESLDLEKPEWLIDWLQCIKLLRNLLKLPTATFYLWPNNQHVLIVLI